MPNRLARFATIISRVSLRSMAHERFVSFALIFKVVAGLAVIEHSNSGRHRQPTDGFVNVRISVLTEYFRKPVVFVIGMRIVFCPSR